MNAVLNSQQQKAVEVENAHALVLAGAGSGKTRTIIERVASLLQKGTPPEKILLLTFTRKASQEIILRLATHLPNADKIRAGTFHNFCLWAMRAHPHFYENITQSVIIDRDDQLSLMKMCRLEILGEKERGISARVSSTSVDVPKSEGLVKILSFARNTDVPLMDYLNRFYANETTEVKLKIEEILKAYRQRKRDRHYLDFDDILVLFAKSLQEPAIGGFFRKKFSHILVDEMQDTNKIQWQILARLIDPAWLFCVGDDAQSIYAFRGANIENVMKFTERLPGAERLKLTINYRSTQRILNLANHILENSRLPYDKKLEAVRAEGSMPILKDFLYPETEAEWIASDIHARMERYGHHLSDFMILTRTAWAARTLEGILIEQKLKYRFIGGFSLLSAAHVKDLLALCRATLSRVDDIAWVRFLSLHPLVGPKKALSVSDKVRACQNNGEVLERVAQELKAEHPAVATLRVAFAEHDSVANLLSSLTEALEPIFSKIYDHWPNRKKDLQLLSSLAGRFKSLKNFIEAYTLDPVTVSAAEQDNEDALSLITVHSAKGLEAKVCYIIQAQLGNFPHTLAQSPEEVEEERRILYVAITRAKDDLILTRTLPNNFFGQQSQEYFLQKLPHLKHLVAYERAEAQFSYHRWDKEPSANEDSDF